MTPSIKYVNVVIKLVSIFVNSTVCFICVMVVITYSFNGLMYIPEVVIHFCGVKFKKRKIINNKYEVWLLTNEADYEKRVLF